MQKKYLVIALATIITGFLYYNFRYEPRVEARMVNKVQENYYNLGLDDVFGDLDITSSCGAREFNLFGERYCRAFVSFNPKEPIGRDEFSSMLEQANTIFSENVWLVNSTSRVAEITSNSTKRRPAGALERRITMTAEKGSCDFSAQHRYLDGEGSDSTYTYASLTCMSNIHLKDYLRI